MSHQIKDIDYLSISTRIRAMENRLLTRERMDRMIDARENGEAMKILTECGYPEDRGGGLEGVLAQAPTESKVGAFLGKVVNTTAAMVTGTGLLTLSEETRPIKGGFIMVDGDIEVNCAFETLVRLQREKLEKEVAGVLFP